MMLLYQQLLNKIVCYTPNKYTNVILSNKPQLCNAWTLAPITSKVMIPFVNTDTETDEFTPESSNRKQPHSCVDVG